MEYDPGVFFTPNHVIFMTSGSKKEEIFTKVQYIPARGFRLDRVAAVNHLLREIEKERLSITEVKARLDQILG